MAPPLEPGLPTHAALFDFQGIFPEQIAESEGGDEAETLLNLWTMLTDRSASADAIEFVADAYARRVGRQPEQTGSMQVCFCNEGWICEVGVIGGRRWRTKRLGSHSSGDGD